MPEGERILIILWHFFLIDMADLKLDFIVTPTYNVDTIAIADISTYPTDPANVDAPTLEISIPGFYTVNIPFIPEELNVLNSTILGITDEGQSPLPDGVYVFKYSITPSYVNYTEKTILRYEKLQQKFDEAFMRLDLMDCNDSIKKQQKVALDSIYYFIQGAVAAANSCATNEAVKLYKKADRMLAEFTQTGECCSTNYLTNFY